MSTTNVESTVAGRIWKLETKPGEQVSAGQAILVLESMKMEIPLYSQVEGTVIEFLVEEGDEVSEGQIVAKLAT